MIDLRVQIPKRKPQPKPVIHHQDDHVTLWHGDCLDVLRELPDDSVDAIVTDPPYELGFMGRAWDNAGIAYDVDMWAGCLRVLKPGGHLAAFGGTRTWHRMVCAIEDAGFEVRDCIQWQHMDHIFCQCDAVPYNHERVSPEGVPSVRQDVAAEGPLPVGTQQDVQPTMRGEVGINDPQGDERAEGEEAGLLHLPGMRQSDMEAGESLQPSVGPGLLTSMQREVPGRGVGQARPQGTPGMDGREPGIGESQDEWPQESGVEGWRDVPQGQGQLHRPPVRQVTEVGFADGSQGRLHHGAPASNGREARATTGTVGSGEPHQPRPEGQPAGEPGIVPEQRGPQTRRGWPVCDWCGKPLAPPVDPSHLSWNYGSGFPKSHDIGKAIDKMDATTEQQSRRYRFTEWVRSTGVTARQIDDATGTRMGGHYLTDQSQPAIMTREHLEQCRHLLGDVPAWVEAEADIRSVESRNYAAREVVGTSDNGIAGGTGKHAGMDNAYGFGAEFDITAPATPEAATWDGWGTALKPAWEPITLCRKPIKGTVAANVLTHGTGAINVDACRVGMSEADAEAINSMGGFGKSGWTNTTSPAYNTNNPDNPMVRTGAQAHTKGRWPANVILDPDAAAILDQQSGESVSPSTSITQGRRRDGSGWDRPVNDRHEGLGVGFGDSGGASRFFYTPKADANERPRVNGVSHPTVKPVDLMAWLCRLITPPGGVILDPFAGSGTTLEAAIVERFRVIGIEREADYIPLIMQRLTRGIEVTLL